jgi:hypothetical protein
MRVPPVVRYSVYLLYWHNSTNTNAAHPHLQSPHEPARVYLGAAPCTHTHARTYTRRQQTARGHFQDARPSISGTQFTCFTGTKVQILTLYIPYQLSLCTDLRVLSVTHSHLPQVYCFTRTKLLSLLALLVRQLSLCTDMRKPSRRYVARFTGTKVLALPVQKYQLSL